MEHDQAGPDVSRLPDEDFEQLAAGGGGPAVITRLWAAEAKRRLLLLRGFLDAATEDLEGTGPLPPIGQAWEALERAERMAPDAVATILMHPQVGNWLAYTLRHRSGGTTPAAPLWVDFGHLHAVAIAACAAAGLSHRTSVPLRDGRVMLPRLGMATFDDCSPWEFAEVATAGGKIWLRHGNVRIDVPPDGREGPGWWPLRSVTVGGSPRLTVWLDDLDPMRDLADPVPPARLPDAEVKRWTSLLADAWAILVERHRPVADALAVGVVALAPLPMHEGWDTRSASGGDAFGGIMCSMPPDAVTLAVSLAHEFAHIKLGGLMHLVPLTDGPGQPFLYAPWRDDPRPAGGLLQGIYAFFAIAAFWRRQRGAARESAQLADFEYAYARAQAREALGVARHDGLLTDAGRRFTARLASEIDAWSGDDLDPDARRLVWLLTDAHRAGWRIRHCMPEPEDVTTLARVWRDGGTDPVPIAPPRRPAPDPRMRRWSNARLGLARRWLATPDRYAAALDEEWGAVLTAADLLLFAGDPVAAMEGFADQIRSDPGSADAWTGLGVAMADAGLPGGAALRDRPDVVAALYRELSERGESPDPAELAAWVEYVMRR